MERKKYKYLICVTTNDINNKVNLYGADKEGKMEFINTYETKGMGTNESNVDPLKAQYSCIVSKDNKLLFVVNGGSNEVSVFRINRNDNTLAFTQKIQSGGIKPVSLACSSRNLYVLNSGDGTTMGNIATFRINTNGSLGVVNNGFKPVGRVGQTFGGIILNDKENRLVVSEIDNNTISTHVLNDRGEIVQQIANRIYGKAPYGICALEEDVILNVERDSKALTSYKLNDMGTITELYRAENTQATEMTKLVVSNDEEFAYTLNTNDGTLSQFIIYEDGEMNLIQSYGTGNKFAKLSDITMTKNGKCIYVLDNSNGSILSFKVYKHGILRLNNILQNTNLKSTGNVGIVTIK